MNLTIKINRNGKERSIMLKITFDYENNYANFRTYNSYKHTS